MQTYLVKIKYVKGIVDGDIMETSILSRSPLDAVESVIHWYTIKGTLKDATILELSAKENK